MRTRAKKTGLSMVAVTASVALLAACGSGGSGGSSTTGGDSVKGKSVYVISCTDEVPWCAKYNSTFVDEFEKAGMKVTVLADPYDAALQNQHMNQAITAKPDAIVLIASDANGIIPAVNRAAAAGIPVINTDAPLSGDADIAFQVLADHEAIGGFAADGIVKGLKAEGKESGNIFIASGALSQGPTQDRLKGFKAYLEKYPEYKLVDVQDTGWNQDKATTMASQVLAQWAPKGGIQAAYGMNDLLALGVVKAAQQANLKVGVKSEGMVVVGGNCLSPGVQALKDDLLYTSATQTPGPEAEAVAAATIEFLNGKKQPKTIMIEQFQITQENVGEFAEQCTF